MKEGRDEGPEMPGGGNHGSGWRRAEMTSGFLFSAHRHHYHLSSSDDAVVVVAPAAVVL